MQSSQEKRKIEKPVADTCCLPQKEDADGKITKGEGKWEN